jgi:hypothetical protein
MIINEYSFIYLENKKCPIEKLGNNKSPPGAGSKS